ncbi:MAG: Ig-like domain-containing protein, partial [Aquabacterium sp.]|uniref:Ig-like domain-containing protein n=1 Tax=Aquabacterium sp. TaxID=1872578 RepID=UPI0027198F77
MPILSKSAGTVIAVWGKAFYHLPNGKLVPVKVGDHIEGGEAILTSQDGIVKITSDDGPTVLLKAKLAAADTDKVITGLNNDELDFNTAAGLQGGGSGGLLPGLRVDRVSESVTAQEYQYSTERGAPTVPFASVEQPLYPAAEVPPVDAPVPVLRVLSDPVVEGQSAVFAVQLSVESKEAITFSLSLRPGVDPATSATLSGNDWDVAEKIEYFNSTTGQWEAYVAGSDLTFKPGDTEVLVRVATKDDSIKESLEYFILNAHVTSGTVQNTDDLGQPDASNEITLIDNEGPALTAQLDPGSDSGTKGDGITNDATPTISGTGDPGTAIKVVIPGTGEELTTTVKDDGTWSVTPTQDVPDGTSGVVQVTGTDPNGNSTSTTVPLSIDTTPPSVLTAQLDPASDSGTKGDGITNDATPTITGTGEPGAQIKVIMPGTNEELTATVGTDGTWTVTPQQDIPHGTTGQAQVTETDTAGNTVVTNVPLSIDTSVPNNGAAPTVTITEDANNDGFINKAELNGNVDVKVAFTPAQVSVGDVVKVTSGGVTNEVSITDQDKANGFVSTTFSAPANGTTMTVSSHIEDAAGNRSATGSDAAKLDLSTLTGLSVSLTTDANDDGFINQNELAGAQTAGAQVKLPVDAVAGDLLTITSTGSAPQTITLTQSHIDAGQVQVSVAAPASGTDLVVTAQVSDAAGNQSAVVSDHAVIATDDILAPKVTIGEDSNNDGYINKVELSGNIDVSVALPATAKAGDSLLVSANGTAQTPIVLTQADIDKGSVSVPGITNPGEGSTLTVTAQVKDVAGNLGATGTDSALIDTTPPSVLTAQLDPASDSGTKGDGITSDATPTISGTGDPGAQIKVTMPGTNEVLTTTVLPNGTWTVTPTQDIPNGTTGQAQVTETDAAGNTTQTTVPLNIDTGVPNNGAAPTVTITEDANNDGFINKAELNGDVDVKVAFTPAQVSVGDVVKITSGGVTKDVTITAQDKASGFVTTTFTAPANGTTMTVTSHIEDSAGNVSATGSDAAKLDLSTLSGLSITLSTDANDDGFINQAELAGGSQVTAQVKLPADAAAGDALNITATGNAPQTIVLTQAQIDAGQVQISLTAPASGTDLVATAQVSDAAGNQSAVVSDHAIIATDDISAPKVTITTDANNDGYINQAEQGASSAIGVQIDLPGSAKAGDSLLVNINGVSQAPIVLTQSDIDNHAVAIPGVTNPGDGNTLTVTAQVKDVAGNLGATGTDSAKIDTTSYSGLGIAITTDGNNDGYISKAELTDNTIGVRVTLPAGAAAGDTLSVTGSGNVAQVITLTAGQLAAGFVDLKVNPPADNTDFVSTASIVDAAGNSAGQVSDAARLQLGVPGAPI